VYTDCSPSAWSAELAGDPTASVRDTKQQSEHNYGADRQTDTPRSWTGPTTHGVDEAWSAQSRRRIQTDRRTDDGWTTERQTQQQHGPAASAIAL